MKVLGLENEDMCEIAAAIENGRALDEPYATRIYAVIEQAFIGDHFVIQDTPGIKVRDGSR